MSDTAIPEEKIPSFIAAIEDRPPIWNYRLQSSFRDKQKLLAEVAALFDVPGENGLQLRTTIQLTRPSHM